MGLTDFASSYELRPSFGMNITLILCQAMETKPKAQQAVSILHNYIMAKPKFQFLAAIH
jgi:hypothetical protein